jgi:hypothetical protein
MRRSRSRLVVPRVPCRSSLLVVVLASLALPWLASAQTTIIASAPPPMPVVGPRLTCAPSTLLLPPETQVRVIAGQEPGHWLFGERDAVVVNAGTSQGVRAGQEYYIRRIVHDPYTPWTSTMKQYSIHTAGVLTIVEARDGVSIATITEMCDGVMEGDYLEPFVRPAAPSAADEGKPDYSAPGRIVMGDERAQTGSAGSLMIVNQGSDQGLHPGQALTIYRPTLSGAGPVLQIGDAHVISVQPLTAVVRVGNTRDAVYVGDLVAIHR